MALSLSKGVAATPIEKMVAEKVYNDGLFRRKRTQQKCDSHFVDTYIEIPPLAVDDKTGEILNKSLVPIIEKGEPFNFYDKIQSYKGDCDIYSILTKFAATGDESLLNQRVKNFGDYYDIPDNINDFTNLAEMKKKELAQYAQEVQRTILEGSSEQVNQLVANLVKAELVRRGFNLEPAKEKEKNE